MLWLNCIGVSTVSDALFQRGALAHNGATGHWGLQHMFSVAAEGVSLTGDGKHHVLSLITPRRFQAARAPDVPQFQSTKQGRL